MTLLTIVQEAQDLISGMARASLVIGNTDPTVRQLLALAKEAGAMLVEAHPWTRLTKNVSRTTVAAEVQPGFLETDFSRFIDGTMWNTSRRQRVYGPLTSKEYASASSRGTQPVYQTFRLRGESALVYPAPASGEVITYEYIANTYAASNAGNGPDISVWTNDTDIGIIPGERGGTTNERLYVLSIVWMWLARKGLDYSVEVAQYEKALQKAIMSDGGRRDINLATQELSVGPNTSPRDYPYVI